MFRQEEACQNARRNVDDGTVTFVFGAGENAKRLLSRRITLKIKKTLRCQSEEQLDLEKVSIGKACTNCDRVKLGNRSCT